ncbi:molybdopterin-guanine dinucleotide biosynthesis protein B [Paenibacillus sp.]|uniref:molybdopterin-guanine dinucleotide biosynthesis protein B n=1 Tax=Paenibacillus sp. TaxID=58172 RepID=UPI002D57C8A2|nr:molybdopterin-guanine dinucleotide biosynthesis protein B [Paenibacillus sp.]HZG88223.1 molybdopterin-guanine dinucleotide biosynthesis protein B [Paenibacillus sp.]
MTETCWPPVVQIVGFKKSGKTTLTCRLVERLASDGYRIGTVKHDGHDFEPDVPGTDSRRHREAGAIMSAVTSPERTAFFENRAASLDELIARMREADLVLVEGWKRERFCKVAMIQEEEHWLTISALAHLGAIVTWNSELLPKMRSLATVPVFAFDETEAIAAFVKAQIRIT